MKRKARALFALGVAVFTASCAGLSGAPGRQDDICAIFAQRPDWRVATAAAARKWGAPVTVQMAIMRQESSFRHDARPPRRWAFFGLIPTGRASSAYGFAQALDGTWDWYLEDTGRTSLLASRDDFDDAVDFIGWYMTKTKQMTGVSMHDAEHQYLAYHEGQGGYKRASYRKKAWLMRVAKKVARTEAAYRRQLPGC